MAITTSGTSITFNDATVQTTAATTPGTTFNSVGSYTWAGRADAGIAAGTTYSGGSLFAFGLAYNRAAPDVIYLNFGIDTLSGTWRAMVTSPLSGYNTSGGPMIRIA